MEKPYPLGNKPHRLFVFVVLSALESGIIIGTHNAPSCLLNSARWKGHFMTGIIM